MKSLMVLGLPKVSPFDGQCRKASLVMSGGRLFVTESNCYAAYISRKQELIAAFARDLPVELTIKLRYSTRG
jgi:hypothetical protein